MRRDVVAALLTALAIVVSPVTASGFLMLLGGMVVAGSLARRFPAWVRRGLGAGCWLAAVAVAARLVQPELPPALPPVVLAALSLWTVLVVGLLWRRMRWLRPVACALSTMLVGCWLPGPDADAVIVVAAVGGLLTALLSEEFPTLVRRRAVLVTVIAVATVVTLLTPGDTRQTPVAEPAPAPAAARAPGPGAVAAPVVRPVTIAIPALGVAGPLENLSADPATGELAAPDDPALAGWYAAGVIPGTPARRSSAATSTPEPDPESSSVCARLQPGDEIEIDRSDGRTVRFTVTAVGRYPKAAFPTAAVYGPAPGPELRLVTCGGQFDRICPQLPGQHRRGRDPALNG